MISVIIPSDGRASLSRAVASIATMAEGIEIIVVDNTADRNLAVPGARVVREAARNIAIVRNAGIAAATGQILVFLDDDQAFLPGAMALLIDALENADAAVAALYPVADGVRISGSLAADAHTRWLDLPPSATIRLVSRWGKPLFRLSTGACAFRREALTARGFDPAFGVTGGEDTDLFCALYRAGRRLVWVPQAEAEELVPIHRQDPAYQLRRLRRESASYRRIRLRYTQSFALTWIELLVIGLIQTAAGVLPLGPRFRALREKGLGKLGVGSGNFAVSANVR